MGPLASNHAQQNRRNCKPAGYLTAAPAASADGWQQSQMQHSMTTGPDLNLEAKPEEQQQNVTC
jgi:hypothetical protein